MASVKGMFIFIALPYKKCMMMDKLKSVVKKERDTQYFFFSGKGGVGKTSVAAATALYFSEAKNKKTLILSTDPAHSLSDSFEEKIGGELKKLTNNLSAIEIDPKKAMEEYKEKFMPKIEKMEYLKNMGLGDTFDVASMTPGIDEIAAFDKFLQYMHSNDYDVIVFDTAPTGHTLRFLSLPDVLDSWIGKLIKLRMKFSGMMNLFKKVLPFGDENEEGGMGTEQLEVMKKRIEDAKLVLSDPKKTHYNIVLIPEAMSILESARSAEVINEYKIPIDHIVINQLIPHNSHCKFCTEKRKIQEGRVNEIHDKFKKYSILKLELLKEEVKGFEILRKVAKELYK
jgi:arsenite-transporting ATPase